MSYLFKKRSRIDFDYNQYIGLSTSSKYYYEYYAAAIKLKLDDFNKKPFQKMKTSRRALFESLDKAALKELPKERYQYAEWSKAKINIDYHFVFDDHYYSVPYRYIYSKSTPFTLTN